MDALERQFELENLSNELGVARYRKALAKAEESGRITDMPPGLRLMKASLKPMAEHLEQWLENGGKGTAGRGRCSDVLNHLQLIPVESLAYLTARSVLTCAGQRNKLTKTVIHIANSLRDEVLARRIAEDHPGYYRLMQRKLRENNSGRAKAKLLRKSAQVTEVDDLEWSEDTKAKVGRALLDMFITSTGMVEVIMVSYGKRNRVNYVVPSEKLRVWMVDQHARCEVMAPVYLPMVIEPKPWTGVFSGGYFTRNDPLVKTRNRRYLAELEFHDLEGVYSAINAIQSTPWRINKPVLDVMTQVWDEGGLLGKLPPRDDLPLPAKPEDIAYNEEAKLNWKREAVLVYDANARVRSRRLAQEQRLQVAEQFVDEPRLYFPHCLDFRGRAYPIPSGACPTPQSDDPGRGLLQFAEGKALGDTGAYWLAIHGAGLWGVDKVSFEDRVQWVKDNESAILESAMNPLDGERFWNEAEKPWCALAFCFEWLGYMMEGDAYVSRLPVAQDGSCNGLQNFSAVLLDEVGGKATNLVPCDEPQDIYTQVAEVANKKVNEDAINGNPVALQWVGNVSRKIAKRPCMTLAYGATKYGMTDQIVAELKKMIEDGNCPIDGDLFAPSKYMAGILWDAIGEVVIAARSAMDWLQAVARVAAKDKLPVRWTAPSGFPVVQAYKKSMSKRHDCHIGGVRHQFIIEDETDTLDTRRQAAGISPNVVHSWDAAHMMATVNGAVDAGVEGFAMIHDSFGCHAADAQTLAEELRAAFVLQYADGVLEKLRDELVDQLPEELAAQLPPIPPKGTLDLDAVTEARYFFA